MLGEKDQMVWDVVRHIHGSKDNIIQVFRVRKLVVAEAHVICWEKPPLGRLKLNVDGSAQGSLGRTGFRGLTVMLMENSSRVSQGMLGSPPMSMPNSWQ